MRGKIYKQAKQKAPKESVDVTAAVTFVKEQARKSFDETIELHVRLGVSAEKSDQMVRGSIQLPSGTPKQKKIAVITDDAAKQKAVKAAGANIVGGQELIDKIIKEGALEVDSIVTTPDMMPKLAKAARILGPKGLMPNPKNGTVTPDIEEAVKALAGGRISYKMDSLGNIHEVIGKASWDAEKTAVNATALINAIRANRPATSKGEFMRSITICSTMGPAVRVRQ
ncbi:MAG: 50S ribosomal protein L1 [Candidatus Andersenbacteria bacterium]|nr:50S ribosomal protein L1 [Candidatus Andersenbacteria bacterium]